MVEKRQGLGKGQEQNKSLTLGDAVTQVAEGIALRALEKTLDNGKMIYFPSLGLVITPDKELKEVKDLTDEERANNPHVG